jgi:putative transposase
MRYRRAIAPRGTYFFTVVTHQRQPFLTHPQNVELLQEAFRYVKQQHPFDINAIVILPDYLHCLWTLPPGDANYSTRWRLIKSYFSHRFHSSPMRVSASRQKKQEKAVWQRRFWEHCIKDEIDFQRHFDYIHFNPVKHGLVSAVKDWQYSSFPRCVSQGIYPPNWGVNENTFAGLTTGE